MSDYSHPLWPGSPEGTSRAHGRHLDQLERRKHGPWHNAGDPNEPVCNSTPDSNYLNGVGFRFRRLVGGGTEIEIGISGGIEGDIVGTLESNWYVSGEGRLPYSGHNDGEIAAFYLDTDTGDIVVGAVAAFTPGSLVEVLQVSGSTVGATSGANQPLSRYSGAILLDLTTPTQPVFIVSGVYAVQAAVQWTAGLTNNIYLESSLNLVESAVSYPPGSPPFAQSTMVNPGGVAVAAVYASHCRVGKMFAADTMSLSAFNADSASHTFDATVTCVLISTLT